MLTGYRIFLTMGVLCATALIGNGQEMLPGTVNYSEGDVLLRGAPISREGAGMYVIGDGQTVETKAGKAEVLLTPGIFVRLGDNSLFKVVAIAGDNVKVELERGEAIVEVDHFVKTRMVDFSSQGVTARLDFKGAYGFDTVNSTVTAYSGKITVDEDRKNTKIDAGHVLRLNETSRRPTKFDASSKSPLWAWTQTRADFASQVAEWTAAELLGLNDGVPLDRGWYWNPWYKSWAFVPLKGYIFTPYGYGLFAPGQTHHLAPIFGDFRTN